MSSNKVLLRCFAYYSNKDKKYYAFCVDLNLADQGNSFEDVIDKLHDNIKLYIESELEYNKINGINNFPYRIAPLNIVLQYYFISSLFYLKYFISRLLNNYKRLLPSPQIVGLEWGWV